MSVESAEVARQAARRLAESVDPGLPQEVEAVLAASSDDESQTQFDGGATIALAALLVSVVSLGWTIYRDLKKDQAKPSLTAVKRRIRAGSSGCRPVWRRPPPPWRNRRRAGLERPFLRTTPLG